MTDKIKSAREEMPEGRNHGDLIRWLDSHKATILKSLSALERLQGVDGMKKDTTYHQELLAKCDDLTVGYNDGYNQAIDDVKARLVADIKREVE